MATEKIKNLSNNKNKYLMLLWGIPILLCILFICLLPYIADYRWERILNSFNPERDPEGSGWIGTQQQLIIDSANLIGEADDMAVTKELFDEGTNYAFISILAHFGWIPSIIMIVVIMMLNIKLIVNAIWVKDIYGKMLIKGIASIFIFESLFNILMNLNMGVQANFSLPLVSYGRLDLIINLCLLSIVLSVYRRKDILINH